MTTTAQTSPGVQGEDPGARGDGPMEAVFKLANASVLPFWTLMLVAPRSRLTRRFVENRAIFVVLGTVYVACLTWTVRSADRELLRETLRNPSVESLSRLLADPAGVTTGWVHYLAFDLFVGRWILLDALEGDRAPRLALGLTFMAGPAGLLFYLLQRGVRVAAKR